jgi:hypothetical protein
MREYTSKIAEAYRLTDRSGPNTDARRSHEAGSKAKNREATSESEKHFFDILLV